MKTQSTMYLVAAIWNLFFHLYLGFCKSCLQIKWKQNYLVEKRKKKKKKAQKVATSKVAYIWFSAKMILLETGLWYVLIQYVLSPWYNCNG